MISLNYHTATPPTRRKQKIFLALILGSILILTLLAPMGVTRITNFQIESIDSTLTLLLLSITLSILCFTIVQTINNNNNEQKEEYKFCGFLLAISSVTWLLVSLSIYALSDKTLDSVGWVQVIKLFYTIIFSILMVIAVIFLIIGSSAFLGILLYDLYSCPATWVFCEMLKQMKYWIKNFFP